MTDALNVVPNENPVSTGVRDTAPLAKGLASVLADTYRLTFKTHAYHWNVEGPLFYSIHKLTEEQYENMFAAADEIAERIRALGRLAPSQISEIIEVSVIKDCDVNGGVKTCQRGGVKVGQFGARALERAALK